MATVETDPVPNTVHSINPVDDTTDVPPAQSPAVDASESHAEKDHQLDSKDTPLPANGDATSSPQEVTKLSPDQLVRYCQFALIVTWNVNNSE